MKHGYFQQTKFFKIVGPALCRINEVIVSALTVVCGGVADPSAGISQTRKSYISGGCQGGGLGGHLRLLMLGIFPCFYSIFGTAGWPNTKDFPDH